MNMEKHKKCINYDSILVGYDFFFKSFTFNENVRCVLLQPLERLCIFVWTYWLRWQYDLAVTVPTPQWVMLSDHRWSWSFVGDATHAPAHSRHCSHRDWGQGNFTFNLNPHKRQILKTQIISQVIHTQRVMKDFQNITVKSIIHVHCKILATFFKRRWNAQNSWQVYENPSECLSIPW